MGKLKDSTCRGAKPTPKRYRLADGHGLSLEVRPSGDKAWLLYYRIDGKGTYKTLGAYPDMGLAAARNAAMAVRVNVKAGHDPRGPKPAADGSDTFETVAQLWYEANRASWVPGHAARVWNRIASDALPDLGDKGVRSITSQDILATLRTVEARGAIDITKRLRQSLQAIFVYAIASGLADANPALGLNAALKKAPKVRSFGFIPPEQLPWFLYRLRESNVTEASKLALLFVMHTACRSEEIRGATWGEIQRDKWLIPAARMKASRDHLVPLTPRTKAILKRMKPQAKGDRLVDLTYNQMHNALRKVTGEAWRDPSGKPATVHGFRSTFRTAATDSELWRDDAIERALAHVEGNKVKASYNRSLYWDERVRMASWWSDYLDAAEAKGVADAERYSLDDLLA